MAIRKVISRSIQDSTVAAIDLAGIANNLSLTGSPTAAAISASIASNASDVFVYDTRKDSDGGAWRKRCQHTSWYNETLNTATRGSRRDFPSVAVIVCTATTMTIYDGDSPDLPMWMVFSPNGIIDWPTSTHTKMAVSALNGGIVVVTEDGGQWFRFIDDTTHIIYSSLTYNVTTDRSIVNRNGSASYTNTGGAVNTYATGGQWVYNDVAMTVLPGAPIDTATGLPTPTIAIATNNSVAVINNDGKVAIITDVENNDSVHRIAFTDDYKIAFSYSDNLTNAYGFVWVGEIPSSTYASGTMYGFSNPTSTIMSEHYNYAGDSGSGSGTGISTPYPTKPKKDTVTGIYGLATYKNRTMSIGSGVGLVNIIRPTPHVSRALDGAANAITTTYNTGWMYGDIKGAYLSDSTVETLSGANALSSTTFYNTGWTTSGGNLFTINANGTVSVTGNGSGSDSFLQSPSFNCVVGRTYVISLTATNTSSTGIGIYLNSAGGPNGYYWSRNFYFVATQASNSFFLYRFGGHVGSATLTSISVSEYDPDRSINYPVTDGYGNGLKVYGSITKTAVNTGNDLVAYSGWSNSNYFEQPYTSALDYGIGDFYYSFWIKTDSNATYSANTYVFERSSISDVNNNRVEARVASPGTLQVYALNTSVNASINITPNVWCKVDILRRSSSILVYVNGVFVSATANMGGSVTDTSATLVVGNRAYFASRSYPLAPTTQLALFKTSGSAPNDAQILRMYNEEKQLFQAGVKACLYGSSNSVTALAYDDSTEYLHVGTSSGRSVFDGLRRIENTTTGVSTAISASNGLVVEQ